MNDHPIKEETAGQIRAGLAFEYPCDDNGIIKGPGKFEREPLFVPFFYDLMLSGCGEDIEDEDGAARFEIEADDKAVFPELAEYKAIVLSEDGNGFVYHRLEK